MQKNAVYRSCASRRPETTDTEICEKQQASKPNKMRRLILLATPWFIPNDKSPCLYLASVISSAVRARRATSHSFEPKRK